LALDKVFFMNFVAFKVDSNAFADTRQTTTRRSGRSRPKSHHRRVVSDTGSIMSMIEDQCFENMDFENLVLETMVMPDHNLQSELTEELAMQAKNLSLNEDSEVIDFFTCLAICNTGRVKNLNAIGF
jgi:hypothetical protein